jgi:voltage-gated potassium channel
MDALKEFCTEFFYGSGAAGLRGRYIMLGLDLMIVGYFIGTSFMPLSDAIVVADMLIGSVLVAELGGRIIADSDRVGLLSKPLALLDIAIILSLFMPAVFGNFAFLRVVRAMRVLRSYPMLSRLKQASIFFARNEDVIFSALNLLVFIFVVTAFVFVLQHEVNAEISNYVDALYFTVTTLTTTGFGDIVLVGSSGRLLAVIIMVVGFALFVRLLQTILRPTKVRYECQTCGLTRHELDAVHCKHCGHELHIRTEGIG